MKLIMLGSGTSTGVPRIGNDWGECDPNEPKNRRTRVSIIVESNAGKRLLVDTSTDLRQQLLANAIDRVDAVFWTHDHADHCHGVDDLRPMRYGRAAAIPGFASAYTVRKLKSRFDYVFSGQHGYPTIVDLNTMENLRIHSGFGIDWVDMPHGPAMSTAYRFDADGKSIGYATDFSEITDDMVALMQDVDVLVTDCLRAEPHPTHAHLAMSLEFGRRCKARRTVLTHLDKSMDYASLQDVDVLVTDCLRAEPHPTHAHLAMSLEFGRRCGAGRTVLTHLDKSMDYASLQDEVPSDVLVGYDGMVLAI